MTRSRLIIVHYLLGFLVLAHALSFATGLELWPFSPYRMYATLRSARVVGHDQLYGVLADGGGEIPLWDARSTAPIGLIVGQHDDDPAATTAALQATLDRYDELRGAG